jgi:AraC family transcriptional regulator
MSQRRNTQHEHQERINEVLYRIHSDLARPLDINRLAAIACYSIHHFQRIFRQVTGERVHDYIRRSRLEWAANLLIFNPQMQIIEVANECGFHSNASFSHAFKAYFGHSPSVWRNGGFERRSRRLKQEWAAIEGNPHGRYYRTDRSADVSRLEVKVRRLEAQHVGYIRHRGYDTGISICWHRLLEWARLQGIEIESQRMIGLHHSTPDLAPFDQCRYVACLTVPEGVYRSGGVGVMEIPGGLYACCRAEGDFGDLLYLMRDLTQGWLPGSDYRALNIPSHAQYSDNHFINESGRFVLEYRLPIAVK